MRRKHPPRGHADASWQDAADPYGTTFAVPRPLPPDAGRAGAARAVGGCPIVPMAPPAASHALPDVPHASADTVAAAAASAGWTESARGASSGDCATCRACSRFGNCGDPVAAGLSDRFGLIAHPGGGRGCPAYSPVNVDRDVSYWRIHLPDGTIDLAISPPQPAEAVRHLHPLAHRVEPIRFDEAWPA